MVGHLGTEQHSPRWRSPRRCSGAFTLFNFLTYGTTQVARLSGAAAHEEAGCLAAQALWLASAIGVLLTATLAAWRCRWST